MLRAFAPTPHLDGVARFGCTTEFRGRPGAVPDPGARPFPTSPSRPGAARLAVVPFLDLSHAHHLEARDRQDRDMGCTHAVYVTFSLIKGPRGGLVWP